jgi:alpha-methylacyl-CoA racemase
MTGPLTGLRVVDLSINAPGPHASMMLADMGAEVVSVVNPHTAGALAYAAAEGDPMLTGRNAPYDALMRGKRSAALDLKSELGREAVLRLAERADVLIEEMRPGKMAALGLGYQALAARNPRLVMCSMTGYGATGPLADRAGHDITYLARSGALSLFRDAAGRPVPPQNILGDYAAGGALAVNGILAALWERERSGQGQHIDHSMTDGITYLMTDLASATLGGGYPVEAWRGALGGAMPLYDVYETSDGKWMALGPLEPKFVTVLAGALDWPDLPALSEDRSRWPELRRGLVERFAARSRADWAELLDPLDACAAPVLELDELSADAQLAAREMIRPMPLRDGKEGFQTGVAPRFSRSATAPAFPPRAPGADTDAILQEIGLAPGSP